MPLFKIGLCNTPNYRKHVPPAFFLVPRAFRTDVAITNPPGVAFSCGEYSLAKTKRYAVAVYELHRKNVLEG